MATRSSHSPRLPSGREECGAARKRVRPLPVPQAEVQTNPQTGPESTAAFGFSLLDRRMEERNRNVSGNIHSKISAYCMRSKDIIDQTLISSNGLWMPESFFFSFCESHTSALPVLVLLYFAGILCAFTESAVLLIYVKFIITNHHGNYQHDLLMDTIFRLHLPLH